MTRHHPSLPNLLSYRLGRYAPDDIAALPCVEPRTENLDRELCRCLASLTAHLNEKTAERKSFRISREIFLCVPSLLIIAALYISLTWPELFKKNLSENYVVFIVGSFIAAFKWITIILKGLFKIEANDSEFAEILKAISELVSPHQKH